MLGLRSLEELDFSFNDKLVFVDPLIMSNSTFPSLRILNLFKTPFAKKVDWSNQNLKAIPPFFNKYLSQTVEDLSLRNNKLSELVLSNSESDLIMLKNLDISMNRLTQLDDSYSSVFIRCAMVNASWNLLENSGILATTFARPLQNKNIIFDLSYNKLTTFPVLFYDFSGTLSLQGNSIKNFIFSDNEFYQSFDRPQFELVVSTVENIELTRLRSLQDLPKPFYDSKKVKSLDISNSLFPYIKYRDNPLYYEWWSWVLSFHKLDSLDFSNALTSSFFLEKEPLTSFDVKENYYLQKPITDNPNHPRPEGM